MTNLLIPLAAFAVTLTGVSGFNSDMLKRAGLNDEQIAAFEEAKELKEAGDKEGARDVLVAAGVDEDVIEQVREAMREYADAVRDAIEEEDYDAFRDAAVGSPLFDIIETEDDFKMLVEAHELMRSGDREAAKDIFEDLGFPASDWSTKFKERRVVPFMSQFNADERAELREAMADKDHERIRQILNDAGVDLPEGQNEKRGWGLGQWHRGEKNDR